ncbi:MAG: hypothetical protein HUU06_10745 [Planctomycetaceae bacterium]|nr:hypothetical protein [Planctomycetota bacterium]NUN53245.1 hypothetical protein [Planctomycetaceae bacterium]
MTSRGDRREIPFAWRIRSLPRWVEVVPGLLYAASAVLKPLILNRLCGPDPWEAANTVLWPVEVLLAYVLLAPRSVAPPEGPPDSVNDHLRQTLRVRENRRRAAARRLGGLLGALLSAGALAVLTFLHFFGSRWNLRAADTSACGCFGPVELPYPAHAAVLLVMTACLGAVFLHGETLLAEGRPPPDTGLAATGLSSGPGPGIPEAGPHGTTVA